MTATPAPGLVGVGLSLAQTAETLADLGPALDAFEPLGLDCVEIFLPSLGVVMGGRTRPRALAEFRRICADRPFAFTLHGPLSGNLGDWDNAALHRDVARASLEAAAEIGGRALVWHGATSPSFEARQRLAAEAEAAGAPICVETMYAEQGRWTPGPAELAEQIAEVGHPFVAATLDFSHAALNAAERGLDYLTEVQALAPHVRHLHVHDSFGRPPAFRPWSRGDAMSYGFGDLHLPPGAGSLPWAELAVLPFGGPSVANLELNPVWRAEWPEAIAWVRRWIAEGRTAQGSAAPADRL